MVEDARSLLLQQRQRQQQQQRQAIDKATQQPVMKLGDRDPATGKYALNSGAGVETNDATKIYDSRRDDQPVLAHQLPDGSWVADGRKANQGTDIEGALEPKNTGYYKGQIFNVEEPVEEAGMPVKVLFYVVRVDPEDGINKKFIYVGGDRKTPTLVYKIANNITIRQWGFTNTGTGLKDWMGGITYLTTVGGARLNLVDLKTGQIFSKVLRSYPPEGGGSVFIPTLEWAGWGFWKEAYFLVTGTASRFFYASLANPANPVYAFPFPPFTGGTASEASGAVTFSPCSTFFWAGEFIELFGTASTSFPGIPSESVPQIIHPALPDRRIIESNYREQYRSVQLFGISKTAAYYTDVFRQSSENYAFKLLGSSGVSTEFVANNSVISIDPNVQNLIGTKLYRRNGGDTATKVRTLDATFRFDVLSLPSIVNSPIEAKAKSLNFPTAVIMAIQYGGKGGKTSTRPLNSRLGYD